MEPRRKVAIVTGAGRASVAVTRDCSPSTDARVVVNDLGSAMEGGGRDARPANAVVDEIVAAGGTAVATAPMSRASTARALVAQAVDEWGRLDILVNQRGHHPRRDELQDGRSDGSIR